jgi:hypothetical protein
MTSMPEPDTVGTRATDPAGQATSHAANVRKLLAFPPQQP